MVDHPNLNSMHQLRVFDVASMGKCAFKRLPHLYGVPTLSHSSYMVAITPCPRISTMYQYHACEAPTCMVDRVGFRRTHSTLVHIDGSCKSGKWCNTQQTCKLFVAIKGLRFMLQMYDTWCWFWAWVHGICVNSSIVDKEALVKTSPLQVEGQCIPIRYHQTKS